MDTRSFPAFRPLPWLRNAHAQTVAAYVLFRSRAPEATGRHVLTLPDGDRVVLHETCPPTWPAGGPVALLLHGLCGDARSSYIVRLADKLTRRGVRTFRMDQRGAGAALGLARRVYHAGASDDLLVTLRTLAQLCPRSPISLVGFSLGGNVVLKLAGEFAGCLPDELRQVIAVCPPIDLAAAAACLRSPMNRIYDRFFQKYLRQLAAPLRQANPAAVPPFRTLEEFNERYLSRAWGFRNAASYYAQSSAAPFLPAIRLPTLILAAADDPLIPVRVFEEAPLSPTTRLVVTEYGGHLGFLGQPVPPDPDRHWMDWRIIDRALGPTETPHPVDHAPGRLSVVLRARPHPTQPTLPASPGPSAARARARGRAWKRQLELGTVIVPFLGVVAALALLGKYGLGLLDIGLLVGMHVLCMVGMGVGYHRLLAHVSFRTGGPLRTILAVLGSMTAQGPLLWWVGVHRRHHAHSDQPGDPHSPNLHGTGLGDKLRGFWHGHIGWMFADGTADWPRYIHDLRRDPVLLQVHRLYFLWVFLGLLIPALAAYAITGTASGFVRGFLWGGLVRVFVGQHIIFCLGSIAHLYGSKPFATPDGSHNNVWISAGSLGEGWHNNHHAFPSAAVHGLKWWQFDPNGWCILALRRLGLAWNVKAPGAEALRQLQKSPGRAEHAA